MVVAGAAQVVEYYNSALDHYFVTWVTDEIAKRQNRAIAWLASNREASRANSTASRIAWRAVSGPWLRGPATADQASVDTLKTGAAPARLDFRLLAAQRCGRQLRRSPTTDSDVRRMALVRDRLTFCTCTQAASTRRWTPTYERNGDGLVQLIPSVRCRYRGGL